MTLQCTLTRLATFAREHDAEQYEPTLRLIKGGGAVLIIHYTGSEIGAVPREAHAFFTGDDALSWIFVYDPGAFAHALEEGLELSQAEDASRRVVADLDGLEAYLSGRAYQ